MLALLYIIGFILLIGFISGGIAKGLEKNSTRRSGK